MTPQQVHAGRKEIADMSYKARALAAGLLGLLLAGSIACANALAAPGPLWFHREAGSKGAGEVIGKASPETVQGEGGKQVIAGEIGGTPIEVASTSVKLEGKIYNNENQAQAELELKYIEPKLVKPALKECKVKIGKENTVKLFGLQAWTWNGEGKQLEEEKGLVASQSPQWVLLPKELAPGATGLPDEQLTTMMFSEGAHCGVLIGTYKIIGTQAGESKPGLGFSASQIVTAAAGKKLVHFWNGTKFIGAETGLAFDGNPAGFAGETTSKAVKQEVGLFEG
jgi:hypothetical protein